MKILLVDDDTVSRQHMASFLERLGHEVTEAEDGSEAFAVFTAGEFHLVLSDIKMPRVSGTQLLHRIRHHPRGNDSLVVLFTAYSEVDTAIEALRAGAYDYLIKPLKVKELVALVERVTEHLALKHDNQLLTRRFEEAVEAAAEQTQKELLFFRKAYLQSVGLGQVGVFSGAMKQVFAQAAVLQADRSVPVLIQGETGTGKELVAKYIHFGQGASGPFVDLNCAALSPYLFESELFGYQGGAFTGALPKGQKGKLDLARGGTLFLDEITEIPGGLQAKLLRVVQEKEYYRVGGLHKIDTDVRLICATNADIDQAVAAGSFREDLYYRLNVGRICVPPLRERQEDIIPLAHMFLNEFAQQKGKRYQKISRKAIERLLSYHWPGNVRELRNLMEWVVLMGDDSELKASQLDLWPGGFPGNSRPDSPETAVFDYQQLRLPENGLPLDEVIKEIILKALTMHDGNITKTAQYLGISRRSLSYRLKTYEKEQIL